MKNFGKYRFFNSGNEVIAVSSYAGKTVRGVAKCNPTDTFNAETGKKLASARCWAKIAQKRYAHMVKKHEEAMQEFKAAQKYLMNTTDYLMEAASELKESTANLQTLEASMNEHQK